MRTEAVSIALLVVLEALSPLERAVFVLHEVFGYPHAEIAEILDRSPSAVRQLGHRAREHIHARRPRFRADPSVQQQITRRFLTAAVGGDLEALLELLAPEVTFWADAGGRLPKASLRVVHGPDHVARMLIGVAGHPPQGLDIRYRHVNGAPAALVFIDSTLFAVWVLELTPQGDQVRAIYVIGNPDKLAHLDSSSPRQKKVP